MSSQIELSVEETTDRLDRYLADQVTDLSRSRLQKLIEQGHVQVNGEVCTSKKLEVRLGDRIQIDIPAAQPLELQAEDIPLDILYEDDSLLILNKPAGLVVHPSAGHEAGTMVNALLAHCPTLPGINGVQRPGIVHRLDKDTTGAIAVAKTEQAFHHLQEQFRTKTARRDYLAIVYGAPPQENGTINQPIGRHPIERQKMAVVSEEKGRRAITHWHIKERLGNYTLVEFELETGRTHQIRVHSAFIGHPIVGDLVYGSGRKSVNVNLPGQALHAWRLRLRHPLTEDWVVAIAPLPATFTKLLEVLKRRM